MSGSLGNKENVGQQGQTIRPRQQFSDAELDKMKRDKVCFRFKATWSVTQKFECPNKTLRVLTLIKLLTQRKKRITRLSTGEPNLTHSIPQFIYGN